MRCFRLAIVLPFLCATSLFGQDVPVISHGSRVEGVTPIGQRGPDHYWFVADTIGTLTIAVVEVPAGRRVQVGFQYHPQPQDPGAPWELVAGLRWVGKGEEVAVPLLRPGTHIIEVLSGLRWEGTAYSFEVSWAPGPPRPEQEPEPRPAPPRHSGPWPDINGIYFCEWRVPWGRAWFEYTLTPDGNYFREGSPPPGESRRTYGRGRWKMTSEFDTGEQKVRVIAMEDDRYYFTYGVDEFQVLTDGMVSTKSNWLPTALWCERMKRGP